jgi:hypothetical protein
MGVQLSAHSFLILKEVRKIKAHHLHGGTEEKAWKASLWKNGLWADILTRDQGEYKAGIPTAHNMILSETTDKFDISLQE